LRRAAQSIAKWMIEGGTADQTNLPIDHLKVVEAIVSERQHFFETRPSRANAWALILQVDMSWQIAKNLGAKKGRDAELRDQYLPASHSAIPLESRHSFASDIYAFDLMNRVYQWHTALRHPSSEWLQTLEELYCDPWEGQHALTLIEASIFAKALLPSIRLRLSEFGSGTY
jgi:hypothetical protein